MTTLDRRAVRRETNTLEPTHGRRPLIVLLEVGGRLLRIREKGTRQWYTVPFDEIYRMGCRIRAEEIRSERTQRRAARGRR